MTSVSLSKLKEIVKGHMKKELNIMEMILHKDKDSVHEFTEWYIAHPYSKGIKELQEIVGRRSNRELNIPRQDICRHYGKKKGH